ncbi:hypothetical protein [Streptomyces sp. NPDC004008]
MRGPVITAENAAYDEAREACNTVIDRRHRATDLPHPGFFANGLDLTAAVRMGSWPEDGHRAHGDVLFRRRARLPHRADERSPQVVAYQLSVALGNWTVWIGLGLAAVWVGTGRWRDCPRPEGRSAEEVAAVARRRSRLVNGSMLAVAALWILANVAIVVWAP